MPVIELKEASKIYGFGDATTLALDEVDLTIEQGEFVAIMGPSGSGKSTLMNVIGLLDRPSHGSFNLNGKSVPRLAASRRAKLRRDEIGFIFQTFNLLPRLNVLDNVALPLMYKGVSLSKRHVQASDMLERVGMREREYYFPHQLSGGQAQRAAIARALINSPRIIIADEPTGNLDSTASRVVMELLSEIHKSGNTILMVTHNPELTRYASRVLYMHDGAIVHDEQTEYGQVAKTARKSLMFMAPPTEDDQLAGVSELMKAVPKNEEVAAKTKRKPRAKKKKITRSKK